MLGFRDDKSEVGEEEDDGVFKHPSSSKVSLSSERAHASRRMLDFDDPGPSASSSSHHVVMTRSMSSLKDKSIQELETQFVPPDVPDDLLPDPYEVTQDDPEFFNFLQETYWEASSTVSAPGTYI